jgi:hypothetical protein
VSYSLTGGRTDDDDNDGEANFWEFVTGGNPTNALSQGHPWTIAKHADHVTVVYPRRINSELTYRLESRTDLFSGTWTNGGYTEVSTIGYFDTNFHAITNTFPVDDDQLYIRLGVQEDSR